MAVSRVAEMYGIYPARLWRVVRHWVRHARRTRRLGVVPALGLVPVQDEDGGHLLTLIADLQRGSVLHTTPAEGWEALLEARSLLLKGGMDVNNVRYLSVPPSLVHREVCLGVFPKARLVLDRTYIVDRIKEAIDAVRDRRNGQVHSEDLIWQARTLAALFQGAWDIGDTELAAGRLAYCCDRARESGLRPFEEIADFVEEHWTVLTAQMESGMDNGTVGKLLEQVSEIQSKGRGYRNPHNRIMMIYLILGGLSFDDPYRRP